jgi:hypothetical protein
MRNNYEKRVLIFLMIVSLVFNLKKELALSLKKKNKDELKRLHQLIVARTGSDQLFLWGS